MWYNENTILWPTPFSSPSAPDSPMDITKLNYTEQLIEACQRGDHDEVARLLGLSDPNYNEGSALMWTVNRNRPLCTALVAEKTDSEHVSRATLMAAEWGRTQCLECLISLCSKDTLNQALEDAAYGGSVEAVRMLLKHADPLANRSSALRWASYVGHQGVFDLLYPISDPQAALDTMKEENDGPAPRRLLEERLEIERLKGVLTGETQHNENPPKGRKL